MPPLQSQDRVAFLSALRSGCINSRICDTRVLVAVSGGADSVALLRGLLLLQESLGLELHVGHLNHQLRGAVSDSDAQWVQRLSDQYNLPCHVGTRSVATMPELAKHGLEGSARIARREFLQQVARENSCSQIALAHTADDQVETILHHIVRGTGLAGLAGMRPADLDSAIADSSTKAQPNEAHVPFVRPMLSIHRHLVESFLADVGQNFRTDATNQDTQLTRNRIRHELLPLLERDFNPQVRQALLRLGEQARDVHSDESDLARQLLQAALLESTPTLCRLLVAPFQNQPPHRVRECFVTLWKNQDWPRQRMGFRDWNSLVELISRATGNITLPSQIQACRRDGILILTAKKLAESF